MGIALGTLLWPGVPASSETPRGGATPGGFTLETVLGQLEGVEAGRRLLDQAAHAWGRPSRADVIHFVRWGTVSKTDAVLTRHYDPDTGKEHRERQIIIYLRQDLDLRETVLDLAHEIVHAKEPPSWDPYDPELTPGKYIFAAIEGPGGEVDAVMGECGVAVDLASNEHAPVAERCKRYLESQGAVSRLKVKKDFYCVGKWKDHLLKRLGPESGKFPSLSEDDPKLFSSTGHTPYPVALFEEFEQMNEVACRNSRKRVDSIRTPASEDPTGAKREDATRFLARRCGNAEV